VGVLKLPGLASGLDTDGLIKTLMSIEQRPMQALAKKRDSMTTQASAWRDLNQRVLTLQKRVEELNALTASDYQARKGATSEPSVATVSGITATAQAGTYTVEVVSLATAKSIQSGPFADGTAPDPDLVANPDTDLGIKGAIQVATGPKAGQTFTIEETDSLNDIVKKINDKSADLGLTATVSQVAPGDYRLVLKGQNGAANDFTLVDGDADNAATKLGLVESSNVLLTSAANGTMKVNSATITFADNIVKDAVGGMTVTALKVGTTTVTLSKDYGKVADAIQKVVDQYNTVMDFIAQQTSYDDKTKATGTLFGDNRVRDIKDGIRTRLFDNVKGLEDQFKNLGILGVGSEKFKAEEKVSTKLVFDREKFNKAMDKDPLKVRALFSQTSEKPEELGVAVRLGAYLNNYTRTDGILPGEAKALDKSVEEIKKKITWWQEVSLPKKEQHLRAQFLALEKSMSTFQNQGNWLSGQIKGLASWSPQ
jgi:flagellar hook-associated protein 2